MKDCGLVRSARSTRSAVLLLTAVLATAFIAALSLACGAGTKVEPEADPGPGARSPEAGVVHTPPPGAATVHVTLREWSVVPDRTSVAAGEVYFLATNAGGLGHELVVIKTDEAPEALPEKDGKVPENDVDLIGEIEPFSPGSSASTVLELESGSYVLICNVVETVNGEKLSHYLNGMRTAFTVQ